MEDELWNLSEYNSKPDVLGEQYFPKKVKFYDTTLRDGEQTIGVAFSKEEKLEIARALDQLGIDRIEAGMPVVSKEDKEAISNILNAGLKAEIWGFCRAIVGDIQACLDVGVKNIVCEIATSPYKMKAYNYTPEWILNRITECLQFAKSRGLYTAFFAVDATRADLGFLEAIYTKAVKEGKADEVVIVDTLGAATPETMFWLTRKVRQWVKVPIATHCHNNVGMGTACSLSSVKAGADCIHATINGLGEITGNADIAELVVASKSYGLDYNLDTRKLYKVSQLVEKLSKVPISPLKPSTGEYIFQRESGVTAAQLISYPPAVEPYSPELFGRDRGVLLSKKSGKRSVEYHLEKLKVKATPEQVDEITNRVKLLGVKKKGILTDSEFAQISREVIKS